MVFGFCAQPFKEKKNNTEMKKFFDTIKVKVKTGHKKNAFLGVLHFLR